MWFVSLSVLIACAVQASDCLLECEQNQNGQTTNSFKTTGDITLIGLFDVYDEKCSGPTATGIHIMELVATVVQILNSIHYVPGVIIGLTLYEVCSHRSSDIDKALISYAVDQDCNNSTVPIAIYTTEDVRTRIAASPQIGSDVPIATVGHAIDVDVHVESAVKFLTVNNVSAVDVLVAQDPGIAQRFERIAKANGLCLNKIVADQEFGNLNDSSIVIIIANKSIIKLILESSSNIHVSHFIIIPLDGPLPPKPDFEYGSYVFQAYGTCPVVNKSGGGGNDGATTTNGYYGLAASLSNAASAEQAVSAQFVQTAADLLHVADAYNERTDEREECGQNATAGCGAATGNRSAVAVAVGSDADAVGSDADAIGRVLDQLQLLPDGGQPYYVTLVHVTEYGGVGETIGAYVQDSNGTRRLQLNGGDGGGGGGGAKYLDACTNGSCPVCPPPATTDHVPVVWVTWKEDVRVASALTVAAVGTICAACIAAFILVRVCKKDVMEGNPTFSLVLVAGTLFMYASALPFAVEDTAYPHAVCYAKLFGASASCSIVFSAMLARTIMIAACDCDSSFMSHVNGYLQTALCAFTVAVQFALLLQFLAIHAIVPSSDLCRVFVNSSHLFLGSLSYDGLLLVLLCATSPFVFRSKRNYREGACFAVAAYLVVAVWACWCTAYAFLPGKWRDTCVMIGLTATATVVVVTVFIPRTYMMMFGIVREQIASSLPSLGYGHSASVTDVNYRSTQALYDSVHVAAPAKCHSSTFKGQSNPNYYSPAGSNVHTVPRSRPLTPVNEYDIPPSPDNRITRF